MRGDKQKLTIHKNGRITYWSAARMCIVRQRDVMPVNFELRLMSEEDKIRLAKHFYSCTDDDDAKQVLKELGV
jgi:hypothetical protein